MPIAVALVLGSFPFAWVGIMIGAIKVTTQEGINTSPEQANRFLAAFDVPDHARDVDYRHSTFSGTADIADFSISESDFLAWAKANGWNMRKFLRNDESTSVWPQTVQPSENGIVSGSNTENATTSSEVWVDPARAYFDDTANMTRVTSGYRYTTSTPQEPGLSVVYDLEAKRAYVSLTRF